MKSSVILTLAASSLVANGAALTANLRASDDCVTNYDANTDYFPEKAQISVSSKFTGINPP
jgi:hypothetical protein